MPTQAWRMAPLWSDLTLFPLSPGAFADRPCGTRKPFMPPLRFLLVYLLATLIPPAAAWAQNGTNEVPFHQDKPPGPALSPEEAMAKMQLPPGFKIECVAHEPEVMNPTSF